MPRVRSVARRMGTGRLGGRRPARGARLAPSADLILWKLHGLLAAWTGELPHYYEAALRRPDLPSGPAALGAALVRAERPREAQEHLRRALADSPLDRETARVYFQALGSRQRFRGPAAAVRGAPPAGPRRAPGRPGGKLVRRAAATRRRIGLHLVQCRGRLEYMRPCLESLLTHTRSPYELVLVAGGCGDDAYGYLEEIRRRPGPTRVEVIRHQTPLGFAQGCNQGPGQGAGPVRGVSGRRRRGDAGLAGVPGGVGLARLALRGAGRPGGQRRPRPRRGSEGTTRDSKSWTVSRPVAAGPAPGGCCR